ncbi:MAG TPA: hypothetical protein VKW78_13975 [Terriglobales bacterium]|nr:hypothetical protein [Terriglobales bacterium]
MADPRASLLFLIPGISEMLRVQGKAVLSTNQALCESFSVSDAAPKVVIVVRIDHVMFQCARAALRSHLWDPAALRSPGHLPTAGQMLADATAGEEGGPEYDKALSERIRSTLY